MFISCSIKVIVNENQLLVFIIVYCIMHGYSYHSPFYNQIIIIVCIIIKNMFNTCVSLRICVVQEMHSRTRAFTIKLLAKLATVSVVTN